MHTQKLVIAMSVGLALSGCANIQKNIDELRELAKTSTSSQPQKRSIQRANKKRLIHDCDLKVEQTRMLGAEEKKQCQLKIISEVEDVEVSQASRFSRKKYWESEKGEKLISLSDCDDAEILLSKKYYDQMKCSASFDNGDTAILELKAKDWLKFGYVRVDYLNGDSPFINVTGLPNTETVKRSASISQKVPLGEYEVKFTADHKVAKDDIAVVPQENHISFFEIDTLKPQSTAILEGRNITLPNGAGSLRILTEKDNVNFTLARKGRSAANIAYKDKKNITAPTFLELPAGDYTLSYNGQSKALTIKNSEEIEVLLANYINVKS